MENVMADFKKAIEFVLKHEDAKLSGEITHDSGGTTRFGISQKAHPNVDIEKLTLIEAEEIYRNEYWRKIRGDEIRDDEVASKLLDMAVNMGSHQAVVLCQRALNVLALHQALKEDGLLGRMTLAALNAADPQLLLVVVRSFCEEFYRHIAAVNPDYHKYLHGWLVRANA
jgi:lysozyme family protein